MFNRNNFPSVPNPFGSGNTPPGGGAGGARPSRDRYNVPSQRPGSQESYGHDNRTGGGYGTAPGRRDHDTVMADGYGEQGGYGGSHMGRPSHMPLANRTSGGQMGAGGGGSDPVLSLRPTKSPDNSYTYRNL